MAFVPTEEHDRQYESAGKIDYNDIDRGLASDVLTKLENWFPDKKIIKSGQWYKLGNRGSLAVHAEDGHWHSHESGDKGPGLLSLYAWQFSIDIVEASEDLKSSNLVPFRSARKQSKSKQPVQWEHSEVPPDSYPTSHFDNGEADHVYKYRDRDGNAVGVVLRWDESFDRDSKDIRPVSWVHFRGKDEPEWKWCAFAEPRPLYRGERIGAAPDLPVLIVEGEKCVQDAEKVLPDWIVVSWSGGAGAVNKADWSGLDTRRIVIWPDNDQPGKEAAACIQKKVPHAEIVDVSEFGEKEDISDAIEAGEIERIRDLLPSEDDIFVNLNDILAGDLEPERPTVAASNSGDFMLYAGRINEIHGEPSVGKTNITLSIMASELMMGNKVMFIDPEDNPEGIIRRALAFGITKDAIRANLKYLHDPSPEEVKMAIKWADRNKPSMVSADGLAEMITMCGFKEDSSEDVLTFFRHYIRPFTNCGAAVLLSDHVTKSTEGRGTWSRGSGAKMGRYDGVSYMVTLAKPYSPKHSGSVKFTIAKDRNGGIGTKGEDVFMAFFEPKEDITSVQIRRLSKEDKLPMDELKQVIQVVEMFEKGGECPNKGTIYKYSYEPPITEKRCRELLKIALENGYVVKADKVPGEHFDRYGIGEILA